MAIFSRRTLQRLIIENSQFLTKEQTKNHVEKLNRGDLGAEWEVVILNVFSKLGKVEHERNFNGKNPDIFFTAFDNSIEFLVEVTTVSDYFPDWENPVKYLEEKLFKIQIEKNLPGGFGVEVKGNNSDVVYLRKKPDLFIPNKKSFDKEIFDKDFKTFINEIVNNPNTPRDYHIKRESIDLKIVYTLNRFSHSSYPSYQEIVSLEDNSIWKALNRKYDQLKKSNYNGNIGIILCDGNCQSLSNPFPPWYGKSSSDVIRHFLRKKPKVDFVLIFYIAQRTNAWEDYEIRCECYEGINFDDSLENFFYNSFCNLKVLFPIPIANAINAVRRLNTKPNETNTLYDNISMQIGGARIKISSRKVLELLAGRIAYDEFPKEAKNYFKNMLDSGKLITDIQIKTELDEDDDSLIISFGKSDAAVSPFEMPVK